MTHLHHLLCGDCKKLSKDFNAWCARPPMPDQRRRAEIIAYLSRIDTFKVFSSIRSGVSTWCQNKRRRERKKENINVDFNNFLSHLFPLFSVDKIYLEFTFLRQLKLSYGSLKNTEHRVRLTWSPNKIHFKAVSERIYIISTYLHFRFICQVRNYNKIMSVMLIIGQTGRPIVKHTSRSRGRNYLRRSEVVKN